MFIATVILIFQQPHPSLFPQFLHTIHHWIMIRIRPVYNLMHGKAWLFKPEDIKELNPELRRWCTPPDVSSYTLRIPAGTKEMFLSSLAKAKKNDLLFVEFYTVKPGDTVGKIARQFGVPIQTIIDLNSLNKKALIIAGKKILIPYKRTAGIRERNSDPGGTRPILTNKPDKKSI